MAFEMAHAFSLACHRQIKEWASPSSGLPFAVFLLRNFFAALPKDLMESAYINGASTWRTFWTIVLPLSVPDLASLAIFQFMWV